MTNTNQNLRNKKVGMNPVNKWYQSYGSNPWQNANFTEHGRNTHWEISTQRNTKKALPVESQKEKYITKGQRDVSKEGVRE